MEGSSDSNWQRSGSSRGLNSSSFLDRINRIVQERTDNTSNDSGSVRKGRERTPWPHITNYRTQIGVNEDGGPLLRSSECSDVSLRQWLDNPERKVDARECVHIFSQIVDTVNFAHSQGIVVHNVRPSCFIMSSYNRVSFIESASCSGSGSDSPEYGETAEFKGLASSLPNNPVNTCASQMNSDTSCLQSSSGQARNADEAERIGDKKICISFPMKQILLMESNWYSSPEEVSGGSSSCASDVYQLGVLLFEVSGRHRFYKKYYECNNISRSFAPYVFADVFHARGETTDLSPIKRCHIGVFGYEQLFCTVGSLEEKSTTMASLRHRVLPPQLLLKWPKEASFCLWLLHPEPSSRPKMSELSQSEFLNEPRDDIKEREAVIELREKIEEQELLLEFLLLLQQRKQDAADSLNETISFISSDVEEVRKMQRALRIKKGSTLDLSKNFTPGPTHSTEDDDFSTSGSRKRIKHDIYTPNNTNNADESDDHSDHQGSVLSKSSRLMRNFRKLESAYFGTRRRAHKPTARPITRCTLISGDGRGSIGATERSSVSNPSSKERFNERQQNQNPWINTFLEGLCKYLSFSNLKVKADLKQGDLLNSFNLVCSLSFDRDGEFFATAGVNKKIKIFEYNSILNEDRDIHYPVVEMGSSSKLSSICWNGYIKSQIASSNFEGAVQVWDVTRSQIFTEMREHDRRVWSVDFSVTDPTMLASGSDDGSVKLWNINQGVSAGTIKTNANVCCVQFPSDSGRSLAFGSADHNIYYYDLRNPKMPLCTLVGHNKTVSYVKFIDSTTLVSSSTDNTLKLWDLSMCTSRVLDSPMQLFTGHLNVKNFVGLSVADGYIATGSETNEVFIYHKAFPMPALSFKFNSTDPLSGDEVDDTAQFISSVCWRGQSSTLIAANSMGNIKVLEMA